MRTVGAPEGASASTSAPSPRLDPLPVAADGSASAPGAPIVGVPEDDRSLSDVLVLHEGPRSVRIARHGPLRASCKGELLAPARGTRYAFPELAVMELAELDEANGCARIRIEECVYRSGPEGTIELLAWVDVTDLAPVVTRPTRLAAKPGTVFADEVHGRWLGPGLEVERLGTVGEWTEVRTPATKPERRGFVRSTDLGVVFDRLWFEEKLQESVEARDRQPLVVDYAPEGPPIAEIKSGSPITITDAHVELVDLDYDAPLAIIGYVPRDLVTEPEPVEMDVWGGLEITVDKSKLGADEVLVAAKTEVYSLGGTPLGVTRDELRLKRGDEPGTVVVETDWGSVVLVVKGEAAGTLMRKPTSRLGPSWPSLGHDVSVERHAESRLHARWTLAPGRRTIPSAR